MTVSGKSKKCLQIPSQRDITYSKECTYLLMLSGKDLLCLRDIPVMTTVRTPQAARFGLHNLLDVGSTGWDMLMCAAKNLS